MGVLWTSSVGQNAWKRPTGRTGVNAGATFTTQHKLRASGSTSGAPSGILFGASPGGPGQAQNNVITVAVGPAMYRTYDSGVSATFGSNGYGQYVPAGFPQHSSIKPSVVTLATSGTTAYNNLVAACITEASGIPDVPGQRRSAWHEPYDEVQGGTFTGPQWSAMTVNYKHDVLGPVNASRNNPIIFNICIQGFTLGASFAAALAAIFTPAAIAAADELGFDCYQPGQQDLAATYAANKGKPWSIPEYGQIAGGSPADVSDANALAFMQANVPRLSTYANPPTNVCWFNGNGTVITGLATHAAADYWQSIT